MASGQSCCYTWSRPGDLGMAFRPASASSGASGGAMVSKIEYTNLPMRLNQLVEAVAGEPVGHCTAPEVAAKIKSAKRPLTIRFGVVEHTWTEPGRLGFRLKETMSGATVGEVQSESLRGFVKKGMLIWSVGGEPMCGRSYDDVLATLQRGERPLTVQFYGAEHTWTSPGALGLKLKRRAGDNTGAVIDEVDPMGNTLPHAVKDGQLLIKVNGLDCSTMEYDQIAALLHAGKEAVEKRRGDLTLTMGSLERSWTRDMEIDFKMRARDPQAAAPDTTAPGLLVAAVHNSALPAEIEAGLAVLQVNGQDVRQLGSGKIQAMLLSPARPLTVLFGPIGAEPEEEDEEDDDEEEEEEEEEEPVPKAAAKAPPKPAPVPEPAAPPAGLSAAQLETLSRCRAELEQLEAAKQEHIATEAYEKAAEVKKQMDAVRAEMERAEQPEVPDFLVGDVDDLLFDPGQPADMLAPAGPSGGLLQPTHHPAHKPQPVASPLDMFGLAPAAGLAQQPVIQQQPQQPMYAQQQLQQPMYAQQQLQQPMYAQQPQQPMYGSQDPQAMMMQNYGLAPNRTTPTGFPPQQPMQSSMPYAGMQQMPAQMQQMPQMPAPMPQIRAGAGVMTGKIGAGFKSSEAIAAEAQQKQQQHQQAMEQQKANQFSSLVDLKQLSIEGDV